MNGLTPPRPRLLPAALAAGLLAAAPAAFAAGTASDQRYQDERAACMQRPEPERAPCLREAAAARQAARKGEFDSGGAYEANRLKRCEALPAAERDACVRRARDEGTASGSVAGGGILREYREVILPPVPPAPAVDIPQQATTVTAPAPAGVAATPAPVLPPQPAPAGVMLQPAR